MLTPVRISPLLWGPTSAWGSPWRLEMSRERARRTTRERGRGGSTPGLAGG